MIKHNRNIKLIFNKILFFNRSSYFCWFIFVWLYKKINIVRTSYALFRIQYKIFLFFLVSSLFFRSWEDLLEKNNDYNQKMKEE